MLAIGNTTTATAATTATTPQPRLVQAAHEFEAQMMQELLKPLNASNGLDGEEDDPTVGSGSALGDFASEALGRGLSEHGGLGIADSIVKSLSQTGSRSPSALVTTSPNGNTALSIRQ